MAYPGIIPLVVVLAAAGVAAVTDVWKFKVYNALTLPLFLSGLAYQALTGGLGGLSQGLLGAVVGFGALVFLYALGGMGAGDVKLMAGIGAWLGASWTLSVVLASALAAGLYAAVVMVATGRLRRTFANLCWLWLQVTTAGPAAVAAPEGRVERALERSDRRRRVVPFAAMVAVGLVATLFWLEQPLAL